MQVSSKVYYYKSSGKVIKCTAESDGLMFVPTLEQDLQEFKNLNFDDVAFIELPYGSLSKTFEKVKEYHVNVKTKEIEFTYYTDKEYEELLKSFEQEQQPVQKDDTENLQSQIEDLTDQIINLKAENLEYKLGE